MKATRFIYLILFVACFLTGFYPYLLRLYSPRRPPSPASVATSAADENNTAIDNFMNEVHKFRQLENLQWDGCMKYRCNDQEKCTKPSTPTKARACCVDLLHQMAVDIDQIMLSFNATSFPFSGTLLGIIREGSVLPNHLSADIDFLLESTSFQYMFQSPEGFLMRLAFYTAGYHVFLDGPYLGRVCFRKESQLGLQLGLEEDIRPEIINSVHGQMGWMYYNYYKYGDLYRTEKRDDLKIMFIYVSKNFPKGIRLEDIYPLRSVKVKDYEFKIPLKSEEMLAVMYGNWTEVKFSMHHD